MEILLDKLFQHHDLNQDELYELLENLNEGTRHQLFDFAHQTRMETYGNRVYMRGLIEFSSYCKQNCQYCGIQRANRHAQRYRLSIEEIIDCCREGNRLGYKTFVLQSGEDPYYSDQLLCELISEIKRQFADTAVTLSIGERSRQSYQSLFEAGADRYLLRHETASRDLYQRLHPKMSFENRREWLFTLKEIGYQVGAGFMVGLPGQTRKDLVEDLVFLKELHPDMVGIGPFIPHKQTPLGQCSGGTVDETLIMLALTRLLLPDVLLPATTAMGTLDPKGREKALKAGANVVMPNLSPVAVREKYSLYEGKICTGDEAAHCRSCIEARIRSAGFEVDMGRGDHINWRRNDECL